MLIDCPVEEVWKLIADPSKTPKWDKFTLEERQTSAGPIGVGTTLVTTLRAFSTNFTFSERVIGYEANRKYSLEFTSGPAKGTVCIWSIENIEGKTRFAETIDYKLGGFWKLVGPFMTRSQEKSTEARADNVKRILESQENPLRA